MPPARNSRPSSVAGSSYQRIYRVVKQVPRGRVTTYGTVARLAGLPGQARLVGYALHALRRGVTVPWHRVINAQGQLSLERDGASAGLSQRLALEAEGVTVNAAGRVSLALYGWRVSGTARGARRTT